MNRNGPVIIIEDDLEDQELMKDAFAELELENDIVFFDDSENALSFLNTTLVEPFIIFSDINMPKFTGLELRQMIQDHAELRIKAIPYILITTSAAQQSVAEAYSKSIQGIFIKPSTFNGIKGLLKSIIVYWQNCVAPDLSKFNG